MIRLLFVFTLAATVAAHAQAPAKSGDRKTLTFQPGAKTPDDRAKEAAAAATAGATAGAAAVAAGVPGRLTVEAATPLTRLPSGDACLDLAAVFFDSLKQGLIDDAYANLTKGSKIGDRPEELRNLKQKTSEAISLFGQIAGFEVIENKTVGTTLRRYTIVSFGRDFPLRWRFYFYKVENQWRLIDLHVDDRLNGIFAEDAETPEPKQ